MGQLKPKDLAGKDGRAFTIRTALPEDAAAIIQYLREVSGETDFLLLTPEEVTMAEEMERQFLEDWLDRDGDLAILAETGGEIMGILNFSNGKRKRVSHQGEFGLSVKKEYQKIGVGRALLESLIEWAKSNPILEKIYLQVMDKNVPALKLYQSAGFVEEGRKKKAVKMEDGTYRDLLIMGLWVGQ